MAASPEQIMIVQERQTEAKPKAADRVLHIRPTSGWVALKMHELWEYRELLYFLIWRDLKVRYKQTALGAAWAVMQPLFTMLIFSLFFGRLAKVPSDGIPYPAFSYAALVPWTFFAHGLTQGSDSLVGSANLIRKVYFPRLLIPIGTVVAGLVDCFIAFLLLLVMIVYYGIKPPHPFLVIPLTLLALTTSLGVGFWLSSFNVKYRDVKYALPFLTQFWMFATPIAYPSSLITVPWQRMVYGLNPMAGVVEGFRWALLGTKTAPGPMVILAALVSLVILFSGAYYFRRMEKTFADTV